MNSRFKKLKGARWSATLKVWHLPDLAVYRIRFKISEKTTGKQALNKIGEINKLAYNNYINLLYLKAYSPATIRTYTVEFAQLLYLLNDKDVNLLDTEALKSYILYCLQTLKLTENHVQSRINAIKFYFEKVLKRPAIVLQIPRPKKANLLPKVIAKDDIGKMIKNTTNLKHKVLLMLIYGMGLRVSEITNLEITDIDSKRMQVHIKVAKGKKDRYVNLPNSVLPILRTYYLAHKPKNIYLKGSMEDNTVLEVLNRFLKRVQRMQELIKKRV